LGFWAARPIPIARGFTLNVVSQCAGGGSGKAFVLPITFPANITLGATIPTGPLPSLFRSRIASDRAIDVCYSWRSNRRTRKGITAGIVVGSVIGLEAMFAGPDLRRVDEPSGAHSRRLSSVSISKALGFIFSRLPSAHSLEFSPAAAFRTRLLLQQTISPVFVISLPLSHVRGQPPIFKFSMILLWAARVFRLELRRELP